MQSSYSRFHEILNRVVKLHELKGKDYGTDTDPYHNIREKAKFQNLPAWYSSISEVSDKLVRIKSFYENGELANEGVVDSILDAVTYLVIGCELFESWTQEDIIRSTQYGVVHREGNTIVCD